MTKEILITASIGMYKDADDKCFMQVITAENQNHYFIPISNAMAMKIRKDDNLKLESTDDVMGNHYKQALNS